MAEDEKIAAEILQEIKAMSADMLASTGRMLASMDRINSELKANGANLEQMGEHIADMKATLESSVGYSERIKRALEKRFGVVDTP